MKTDNYKSLNIIRGNIIIIFHENNNNNKGVFLELVTAKNHSYGMKSVQTSVLHKWV